MLSEDREEFLRGDDETQRIGGKFCGNMQSYVVFRGKSHFPCQVSVRKVVE